MLKVIFRHNACRRFSTSRIWKKPEIENKVTKSTQDVAPENTRNKGVNIDFVPSEFEKTLLVLSGRYKSKAEIPPRISYDAMDRARSYIRIRGSIILMSLCLVCCVYRVWSGKKKSREAKERKGLYY